MFCPFPHLFLKMYAFYFNGKVLSRAELTVWACQSVCLWTYRPPTGCCLRSKLLGKGTHWYGVALVQCSSGTGYLWYSVPLVRVTAGTVYLWYTGLGLPLVTLCTSGTLYLWYGLPLVRVTAGTVYSVPLVHCTSGTIHLLGRGLSNGPLWTGPGGSWFRPALVQTGPGGSWSPISLCL